MTDEDLDTAMRKALQTTPQTDLTSGGLVLAELPISGTKLHQIATGKALTITANGELFAVRFLLKDSFKSPKSNYVINNFVMQILPVGKNNAMQPTEMAIKTKVKTVIKEKLVKEKKVVEEINFEVGEEKEMH